MSCETLRAGMPAYTALTQDTFREKFMSTKRPPAISGVSSDKEAIVMVTHPSIAATGLGRKLGELVESVPAKVGGVKLSYLLAIPFAPMAVAPFAWLRLFGEVYVLTNRGVQKRAALGDRLLSEIPLSQIAEVRIDTQPGQAFFPAADLVFIDKAGKVAFRLEGVRHPDVFRQIILEARDARKQVEASLATIRARQPA